MTRTWKSVRAESIRKGRLSEASIAEARLEAEAAITEMQLSELRREAGRSQSDMAELLGISQGRVSRLERGDLARTEVGTLMRYVRALGADLRIVADIGNRSVVLADQSTSLPEASVEDPDPPLPSLFLFEPHSVAEYAHA